MHIFYLIIIIFDGDLEVDEMSLLIYYVRILSVNKRIKCQTDDRRRRLRNWQIYVLTSNYRSKPNFFQRWFPTPINIKRTLPSPTPIHKTPKKKTQSLPLSLSRPLPGACYLHSSFHLCCPRVRLLGIVNNMIHLLFTVIFAEMTLIMILLFKTPLRKLVIMALDRVKRGRGPVMVQTVAGTVFVVLMSSIYSMMKIQNRDLEPGMINPTDQVLMARHMLEASLMGNFPFSIPFFPFFFFLSF